MKQDIVTTNIRVQENHYIQLKRRAAELSMSVNEYLNWVVERDISTAHCAPVQKNKKKKSIYDVLSALARKKYKSKPMGASEDDKLIYDI